MHTGRATGVRGTLPHRGWPRPRGVATIAGAGRPYPADFPVTPAPAMNFPLELRFKLIALASQIFVRDAAGNLVAYVRQKMFKLKEDVVVYADAEQTRPAYRIRADRILDIAAEYMITEHASGAALGSVKRRAMSSLWRAHYEIRSASGETYTLREESMWIAFLDGLVSQIPIVGALAGYVFHAAYRVTRTGSDAALIRVVKQPALFEGRFRVEAVGAMTDAEQELLVLGALMMLLLERSRS